MIKIIFSLILIFAYNSAFAGDLEDAYYKAIKDCSDNADQLFKSLNELDKKISEYKKTTTTKDLFEKARVGSFEGQIILYLGAYTLGPITEGELVPQRTCWLYYNNFLVHENKGNHSDSKKDFKNWQNCLGGLNAPTPEVVENVVTCYKKSHAN